MQPGSTAFTRMPCSPRTAPSALASMLTAAFVPQYATCEGELTCADSELVQQIAPPCPSLIPVQAPVTNATLPVNRFSISPSLRLISRPVAAPGCGATAAAGTRCPAADMTCPRPADGGSCGSGSPSGRS